MPWRLCNSWARSRRHAQVLVAPDQLGTYEIRVNQPNMAICESANTDCSSFKTSAPPEGTVHTFTLQVCKDASLADCTLTPTSEREGTPGAAPCGARFAVPQCVTSVTANNSLAATDANWSHCALLISHPTPGPCLVSCVSAETPAAAGFRRLTAAADYYADSAPPCGTTSSPVNNLPAGTVVWYTGKKSPSACSPTKEDRCYIKIQLVASDWTHGGTEFWVPGCAAGANQVWVLAGRLVGGLDSSE